MCEYERERERVFPFCSTLLHSSVFTGASHHGWEDLGNTHTPDRYCILYIRYTVYSIAGHYKTQTQCVFTANIAGGSLTFHDGKVKQL